MEKTSKSRDISSSIEIDDRNRIEYYEGSWRVLHWEKDVDPSKFTIWNCKMTYHIKLSDAIMYFLNNYSLSKITSLLEIIDRINQFEKVCISLTSELDKKIKKLHSGSIEIE